MAGLGDPYVLVHAVRNIHGTIIDFVVDEANPAACAFHRMPQGQFIGGSLLNPMPAAISGALGDLCAEVLEQGVPCHRDGFRAASPHGDRPDRWYDFHAAPVGDRVSVIWRDVTGQHLALQALQDSEQPYRLLAENASDVVLMVDSADRYVWASPSLEEALGWKHDDLLNRMSAEFVHPDDLPGVLAARTNQNEGVRRHRPFRVRRSDGTYRSVSTITRDLHDAAGQTAGRVIPLRDVHEETVARQSLEKSEELFRVVLTSSTTGMILCDLTGRIQVVNEALCTMLLRDEAWLLARRTDELVHPDDRATVIQARALTIAIAARAPFRELRMVRADGAIIWARRTASVIRTSAGAPERLVVQLEDVTAEHESREELLFQAHNDRLTGMHNRDWILRVLEQDRRRRSECIRARGCRTCRGEHHGCSQHRALDPRTPDHPDGVDGNRPLHGQFHRRQSSSGHRLRSLPGQEVGQGPVAVLRRHDALPGDGAAHHRGRNPHFAAEGRFRRLLPADRRPPRSLHRRL
ncbi:PAS domain S-box protein [Cryobacterium sp. 10I1]|nr:MULTISPECIES: PAS domain S-box protein [unclassified Cryobacterium]MDY7527290.1 PAS domain S-box protein [Cryobacterium sp. 10C2]MDY7556923.1 PAS domain S-box protein [Cryobacterium sp. 10C3]MEB0003388.1 PAS domain S-box protein [Cryobacterium sp. RTC2.1]MEB0201362.1 PAS domain S-box protein [Cryobacterium sp. 5I3]MEB0285840.1 PAS domain S-box protein [Cryobacterium sp. 10S3]